MAEGSDAVVAVRARIVLCAAEGTGRAQIAREVGVSLPTVDRWLARYGELGAVGLAGGARGRPRKQRPEAGASPSAQGSGSDGPSVTLGEASGAASRPLEPPDSQASRRRSRSVVNEVVEQFVVVPAGPGAEMLREEQTKALRNILQWLAEHREPPESA
jgi:hypothetical protein